MIWVASDSLEKASSLQKLADAFRERCGLCFCSESCRFCLYVASLLYYTVFTCLSHGSLKVWMVACTTSGRRIGDWFIREALPLSSSGCRGRLLLPRRHFDSYYGMPSKVHSHVCVRCIGGCCLDEIAEHILSTHVLQRLHILYS
jgi:hypothetical protein